MIYMDQDDQLLFLAQTNLTTENDHFMLRTATSNDVDARISVSSGERETLNKVEFSRPSKSRKMDRHAIYFSATKFANILVKNRKKEKIDLQLEIEIVGVIDGKSLKRKNNVRIVDKPDSDEFNPTNLLTWNSNVEKEDLKELTFSYEVKSCEFHSY